MRWLFIVLLLVATPAIAAVSKATDLECLQYALYKEARGEGPRGQRAVLDVIENRMKASGDSACVVLRKPGQFPYFKKGVKKVGFSFALRYSIISDMNSVLPDEDYKYFNHVKHPFGKNTIKIGKLYFSK